MRNFFYLVLISLAACHETKQIEEDYTKYVKPNIGTAHSRYFFYTPAAVPFGMAKLAPSTNGSYGNIDGWEAVGYDERHTSIEGFPNFHEFQIGGVVFAPTVGTLQTQPGKLEDPESGYRSRFDHKDEYATAGYYKVLLKDYNVTAELTATDRVGFHRYTFPKSDSSHIIFDIGHRMGESGPVLDAEVKLLDSNRVEGYVVTKPEYVRKYQSDATVPLYFSAVLDKTPQAYGVFTDSAVTKGEKAIKGKGAGVYLTFKTSEGEQINIKAGLSYTSVANARLNLETEASNLTFDQAKEKAIATWNEQLGRIAVEGGLEDDKVKFYTGLYHAILGRGLASDVNGAYPKNDGSIGQIQLDNNGKPVHPFYNTDAIWGGYWNLTPLWALAYPEYYADFIKGQLLIYKETGWLADGLAAGKYVSGVGTNFTGLVIAAGYNAGIRDFDVNLGYEAALKNEIGYQGRVPGAGKMDVGAFVNRGFSPYILNDDKGSRELTTNGSQFGTSHTLEYAFSSYAVAQFAKALGKTDDYKQLSKQAESWKFLYDSTTKFIRPRDINGDFIKDFDPSAPWVGFQEGNAWQYTFFVPHAPEELISRIGQDIFNRRLDSIFTISQANIFGGGKEIDAFAGLKGLYNQGNQPNLHISWLFNFSGRPDLTQKWVRAICNEFYGTEGIHGYGYGQDEDQGQMGAWYVLAGIGLFDVKGLTAPNASFQLGSPLFNKITINGKTHPFVITAENNGKDNIYINEAVLNGKPATEIPYQDIMKGGTLNLKMASKPFSK
ncbi:GH92 family glycosyl hydrolase [Chitinophaga tropicalis]|uniref:Glycoside hydrolase family 92 protein n=1 Tax=Chitinophaga tropicalis TaxID=2683588 RepID=A0A7K1UCS8_9BACT|nr:GH92 family glycosyl hydrolase [Chitinophaga tropicalis]MVT12090.1 glycoside hydrolase family 92 protein [Chitinophaga tropicalis]